MGDGVDLGGATRLFGGREAALAVDEVRGEDGVDQRRFAETGLACVLVSTSLISLGLGGMRIERTNADDVELEAALQQLLLDLAGDAVETDVRLGEHGALRLRGHG